jgi:hypothetical protein
VLWDEMQHSPYFNYKAADGLIHQVRRGWMWGCGPWQGPVCDCFLASTRATCAWQAAGRLLCSKCQLCALV